MRVGIAGLLITFVLACGDDDVGVTVDSGFSQRDASTSCVPYYFARPDLLDAGFDFDAGSDLLSCEMHPGALDSECGDIDWRFGRGETIQLRGCCAPTTGGSGSCGLLDPTGNLGCVARQVFGHAASSCTVGGDLDSGTLDSGLDGDAGG